MTLSRNSGPTFDMNVNPVYQVDCQFDAKGKRIALTKRRVSWRFGFSDAKAIAKGLQGANCRGAEHEVVMVWSVTSGKQCVLADGIEVHFANNLTDKLEASWMMRGGHQLKVVAYAAAPLFPPPGFRQFDLLIDGLSFWDMPRMFELGLRTRGGMRPPRVRSSPAYNTNRNNYAMPEGGEPHFSRKPQGSRRSPDLHASMPTLPPRDLPQAPTQSTDIPRSNSVPNDLLSEDPVPVADLLDAPVPTVSSPTSVMMDEFTPLAPEPVKPNFQNTADQILNCYTSPSQPTPTYPALMNTPCSNGQGYHAPVNQPQQHAVVTPTSTSPASTFSTYSPVPYRSVSGNNAESVEVAYGEQPVSDVAPAAPTLPLVTPSMAPLSLRDLDGPTEEMSPMDKAVKSLVNLEDISTLVDTPEQIKAAEKREASRPPKSVPKPPTAPEWHLGQNASLSDIKTNAPTRQQPKKEIMRTHAFDPAAAQAGMMVVYGSSPPPQPYGGIPSIAGFGAGVHSAHFGAVYAGQ